MSNHREEAQDGRQDSDLEVELEMGFSVRRMHSMVNQSFFQTTTDLFTRYCHKMDSGGVQGFNKALAREVVEKLGQLDFLIAKIRELEGQHHEILQSSLSVWEDRISSGTPLEDARILRIGRDAM